MQEAHAQLPKQIKKIYSRPKNQLFSSLRLSTSDIARKLHTNCPLAGGSVWAKKYTKVSLTLETFSLTLKTFSLTLKKRVCAKQRQIDKGTDIEIEKGWSPHPSNGQNIQNRQTVGWKQEGALTWRCQPLLSLPRPVRTTIAVREDGIWRFPTAETDFANDVGYSLFLHLPGDAVWC